MKTAVSCIAVLVFTGWAGAANQHGAADQHEAGRKAEQQACIQCHSLRLVHSQRLSAAAWNKEITKMVGWGAPVTDRQALLDYLSEEYSDSKPVPAPEVSGQSSK